MNAWTLWAWPFFDHRHTELVRRLSAFQLPGDAAAHGEAALGDISRSIVRALGGAGLIDTVLPPEGQAIDLRSVCIAREALAYRSGLADTLLAMQGIGTQAVAA